MSTLICCSNDIHLRMVASFFICGEARLQCKSRDWLGNGEGRHDLIDSLLPRAKRKN
jgi:hypothetical protein